MLEKITEKDFIDKIFDKNIEIIQEYAREKGIIENKVYEELSSIISNLKHEMLHIESSEPGVFQLKDINKTLKVRLGYYQIFGELQEGDLEKYVEQCTLQLTKKGKEVSEQYRKLASN